jgi:hypothetical protein
MIASRLSCHSGLCRVVAFRDVLRRRPGALRNQPSR